MTTEAEPPKRATSSRHCKTLSQPKRRGNVKANSNHRRQLRRRAIRRIGRNLFAGQINIPKNTLKEGATTVDLETPGSLDGISRRRVAGIGDGDLDRPGVVEKSDEVERMLRSMSRKFA